MDTRQTFQTEQWSSDPEDASETSSGEWKLSEVAVPDPYSGELSTTEFLVQQGYPRMSIQEWERYIVENDLEYDVTDDLVYKECKEVGAGFTHQCNRLREARVVGNSIPRRREFKEQECNPVEIGDFTLGAYGMEDGKERKKFENRDLQTFEKHRVYAQVGKAYAGHEWIVPSNPHQANVNSEENDREELISDFENSLQALACYSQTNRNFTSSHVKKIHEDLKTEVENLKEMVKRECGLTSHFRFSGWESREIVPDYFTSDILSRNKMENMIAEMLRAPKSDDPPLINSKLFNSSEQANEKSNGKVEKKEEEVEDTVQKGDDRWFWSRWWNPSKDESSERTSGWAFRVEHDLNTQTKKDISQLASFVGSLKTMFAERLPQDTDDLRQYSLALTEYALLFLGFYVADGVAAKTLAASQFIMRISRETAITTMITEGFWWLFTWIGSFFEEKKMRSESLEVFSSIKDYAAITVETIAVYIKQFWNLIVSTISKLFGKKEMLAEGFSDSKFVTWAKEIRAIANLGKALEWMSGWIWTAISWVYSKFTGRPLVKGANKVLIDEALEWCEKYKGFAEGISEAIVANSFEVCDVCIKRYNEGEALAERLMTAGISSATFTAFFNMLADAKKMALNAQKYRREALGRFEPVWYYFLGASKKGKTTLMRHLAQNMYVLHQRVMGVGVAEIGGPLIYNRGMSQKYAGGYHEQFVYSRDDLFQSTDADERHAEACELIELRNCSSIILEGGDVASKEQKFNSKIIITTTNVAANEQLNLKIRSMEAFLRRRDFVIEVRWRKERCDKDGKLLPEFASRVDYDNWVFVLYDPERPSEQLGQPLNYIELLRLLGDHYINKLKNSQNLETEFFNKFVDWDEIIDVGNLYPTRIRNINTETEWMKQMQKKPQMEEMAKRLNERKDDAYAKMAKMITQGKNASKKSEEYKQKKDDQKVPQKTQTIPEIMEEIDGKIVSEGRKNDFKAEFNEAKEEELRKADEKLYEELSRKYGFESPKAAEMRTRLSREEFDGLFDSSLVQQLTKFKDWETFSKAFNTATKLLSEDLQVERTGCIEALYSAYVAYCKRYGESFYRSVLGDSPEAKLIIVHDKIALPCTLSAMYVQSKVIKEIIIENDCKVAMVDNPTWNWILTAFSVLSSGFLLYKLYQSFQSSDSSSVKKKNWLYSENEYVGQREGKAEPKKKRTSAPKIKTKKLSLTSETAATDELLDEKVKKNALIIQYYPDGATMTGGNQANIAMIDGRRGVSVLHLLVTAIGKKKADASIFKLVNPSTGFEYKVPVSKCKMRSAPKLDQIWIRFPKDMPKFPSLLKHIISWNEFEHCNKQWSKMLVPHKKGHRPVTASDCEYLRDGEYTLAATGEKIEVEHVMWYKVQSAPGWCGSLGVIDNDHVAHKIAFLHVCGDGGAGCGTMLFRDYVEKALAHADLQEEDEPVAPTTKNMTSETLNVELLPVQDCELDFSTTPEQKEIKVLGQVKDTRLHQAVPNKSNLILSVFGQEQCFGEPAYAPARLKKFKKPDGTVVSPLQKAIDKNKSPKPKHQLTQYMADEVTMWLMDEVPVRYPGVIFSQAEAINGCPETQTLGALHMNKSKGWTSIPLPVNKGKKVLFLNIGTEEKPWWVMTEWNQMEYEKYLADCKAGKVGNNVAVWSLKDEKLTMEKVMEGLTRLFMNQSCNNLILMRQYFGAWVENNALCFDETGVLKGLDPYKSDYIRLVKRFEKIGIPWEKMKGVDMDVKKFDQNQMRQVRWAVIKGINAWYERANLVAVKPRSRAQILEDHKVRETLWADVSDAMVIAIKGYLVHVENLWGSGHFLTYDGGSWIERIQFYCMLLRTLITMYKRPDWFEQTTGLKWEDHKLVVQQAVTNWRKFLRRHVADSTGGDDILAGFSGGLQDFINYKNLAESYALYGIEITHADKRSTDDYALKLMPDCWILKRKISFHNGILAARKDLNEACLRAYYVKNTLPWEKANRELARDILFEAALYGEEVFYDYEKRLNDILTRNGLRKVFVSYPERFAMQTGMLFIEDANELPVVKRLRFSGMLSESGKAWTSMTEALYQIYGFKLKFTAVQDPFPRWTGTTVFDGKTYKLVRDSKKKLENELISQIATVYGVIRAAPIYLEDDSEFRCAVERSRNQVSQSASNQGFVLSKDSFPPLGSDGEQKKEEMVNSFHKLEVEPLDDMILNEMRRLVISSKYDKEADKLKENDKTFLLTLLKKMRSESQNVSEPTPIVTEQVGITTINQIEEPAPSVLTSIDTQPFYEGINPYVETGLEQILSRPQLMGMVTFSGSQAQNTNVFDYVLPYDFFQIATKQKELLDKFHFRRFDIEVRIVPNAVPTMKGFAHIGYSIHEDGIGNATDNFRFSNIWTHSQLDSSILSFTASNPIVITLPYVSPKPYMTDEEDDRKSYLGRLVCKTIAPLQQNLTSTTPTFTANVYMRIVRPKYAGQTHHLPMSSKQKMSKMRSESMKAEQKAKSESGIISDTLNAVSQLSSVVSRLPIPPSWGAAAKGASGLFQSAGKWAKDRGWNKPDSLSAPEKVMQQALDDVNWGSGVNTQRSLALHPENMVANSPDIYRMTAHEMNILDIMKRPSLVDMITIDSTVVAGDVVYKMPITPMYCPVYTNGSMPDVDTIFYHTPASVCASNGAKWRGGMKVGIYISGTTFDQVGLKFSHIPSGTEVFMNLNEQSGDFVSEDVVFNGEGQVGYFLPYNGETMFKDISRDVYTNSVNGAFVISVNLPPKAGASDEDSQIYIAIYLAAADDMQIGQPWDVMYVPGSYEYTRQIWKASAAQAGTRVNPWSMSSMRSQASGNIEYNIKRWFSQEFPGLVKTHGMKYDNICISDKIETVNSILHRFVKIKEQVFTTNDEVFDTNNIIVNVCDLDRLDSPWNQFMISIPFNRFQTCFAFRSGGFCYKVVFKPVSANPTSNGIMTACNAVQFNEMTGPENLIKGTYDLVSGFSRLVGFHGAVVENFNIKPSLEVALPYYGKYPIVGNFSHFDDETEEMALYLHWKGTSTINTDIYMSTKDDFSFGYFLSAPIEVLRFRPAMVSKKPAENSVKI